MMDLPSFFSLRGGKPVGVVFCTVQPHPMPNEWKGKEKEKEYE